MQEKENVREVEEREVDLQISEAIGKVLDVLDGYPYGVVDKVAFLLRGEVGRRMDKATWRKQPCVDQEI